MILTIFIATLIFISVALYDWYWGDKNGKKWSSQLYKKNILCAAASVAVQQLYKPLIILLYHFIESNFGLLRLNASSWVVMIVGFLLSDLMLYIWHRLSHKVPFLWGGHAIHHTSPEFNMGLTFRISMIGPMFMFIFHLPLALIGIPTETFVFALLISTLWQLWLHTESIKQIPLLEMVFVTPATHVVHHATNDIYIDKNFGASLIIWDKMFGTYQKKTTPFSFVLSEDVSSFGVLESNVFYYQRMLKWRLSNSAKKINA